jgi:hypothetical protein
MQKDKTAIERAFELAKSGKFRVVAEVRNALSREGYVDLQIAGPALLKQLRLFIVTARQGLE